MNDENEPTPATGAVPLHAQHHVDACSYSVEVAKQFITLGSAGVAFLIGLGVASGPARPTLHVSAIALMGMSVIIGVGYIMNVVGHIHRDNDYNIYGSRLKWIAICQIALFAGAAGLAAAFVWDRLRPTTSSLSDRSRTIVVVSPAGQKARFDIPADASVTIRTGEAGEIEVTVPATR